MSNVLATITLIESQVNEVSKKTGRSYSFTNFHYNVGGVVQVKKILDRELRDIICNTFKQGDLVRLEISNVNGFDNIVSIQKAEGEVPPPVATATAAPKASVHGSQDREIGMQVGNSLTNATTLLAHGHFPEGTTLEEAAVHVIKVGNSLRTRLQSGEFEE